MNKPRRYPAAEKRGDQDDQKPERNGQVAWAQGADDGEWTKAGDAVRFSYGIPPVVVDAKIVRRGGSLVALTPGHDPVEMNLRQLRRHVGGWRKLEKEP